MCDGASYSILQDQTEFSLGRKRSKIILVIVHSIKSGGLMSAS